MHISASPYFQLGLGFRATTPEHLHRKLLYHYSTRAQDLIIRRQTRLPDHDRLQLIVEAAMEARALYFVAAMNEPSTGPRRAVAVRTATGGRRFARSFSPFLTSAHCRQAGHTHRRNGRNQTTAPRIQIDARG